MPDPYKRITKMLGSQSELARLLGLSQQTVNFWFVSRRVPAEHCRRIEALTDGRVTRYQLRPDVFGKGPNEKTPATGRSR